LFLGAGADTTSVRERIAGAGDIAAVSLAQPVGTGAARPRPEPPAPRASRQVRVEESRLDSLAEGIGELSVLKNRLASLAGDAGVVAMVDRMGGLLSELQLAVLAMRM